MCRMLRGCLLVLALVGVLAASAAAAPSRPEACIATNARFRSTDRVELAGAVLGRGRTGVVFAHQVAGDRCQWLPFARELAGKGYRSLVFDMRGYGASAGIANVNPHLDVAAAAAELRRRGARRILLVGASMGGTGVVGAAPLVRPVIAGLVELSAPTGFGGVNALTAARRSKSPALFIAGRDDGDFAAASRALYRASAARDKTLLIAPTSWHGVDLVSLQNVKNVVLGFLRRVGRT
jgi:alpha-beta hydrolase superfamily lysophospholipase